MLQDLATQASTVLATVSMLFFLAVYALVVVRVMRASRSDLDAYARMALDPPSSEASEGHFLNDGSKDDAAPQGAR